MAEVRCIWEAGAELGEGVFWHAAEEAVYWVDIIQSNLYRLGVDGGKERWHFPGHISAVAPCQGGGLLATFEHGLSHIDLETETVTPLVSLETELPDNRFNDGTVDTRGQFWFGSMDDRQQHRSGSFYCLGQDGRVERLDTFGTYCITNGPAFSVDGRWIYFTDTVERIVYRTLLNIHGQPEVREVYLRFSESDGHPDGMCADTAGGLWVCHFGGGRVSRFLPSGELDQSIAMPVPNITKCALGGRGMNTLYITTAAVSLSDAQRKEYPLAGGLFAVDTPYKGVPTQTAVKPLPNAS